ncbi:MAG: flagellar motor switch protein FliN [Baekduia sp.]
MSTELAAVPDPEGTPVQAGPEPDLGRLTDVSVELAVEVGRTFMSLGEAMALGPGSVVTLDRLADKPVDLLINGRSIARGEVVVIDEQFGLRITEVVSTEVHVHAEEASGDFVSLDAPALSAAPDPDAGGEPAADGNMDPDAIAAMFEQNDGGDEPAAETEPTAEEPPAEAA